MGQIGSTESKHLSKSWLKNGRASGDGLEAQGAGNPPLHGERYRVDSRIRLSGGILQRRAQSGKNLDNNKEN